MEIVKKSNRIGKMNSFNYNMANNIVQSMKYKVNKQMSQNSTPVSPTSKHKKGNLSMPAMRRNKSNSKNDRQRQSREPHTTKNPFLGLNLKPLKLKRQPLS